jgi:hypothetical protein
MIVLNIIILLINKYHYNKLMIDKIGNNFEEQYFYRELFTGKKMLDFLENKNINILHKLNLYKQYDYIHPDLSKLKGNLFKGMEKEIEDWEF